MVSLLIRFAVTAIAVGAAVNLVPGIHVGDQAAKAVVLTAVILGIINAIVRPVLRFFSFPLILITLGLFILVINTICLYLAVLVSRSIFGTQITFEGIWPAILGAIVISIVSTILNWVLPDGR